MKNSNKIPDSNCTLTLSMKSLLRHWYRKRFVNCQHTIELMKATSGPMDIKALGIVALLDVDSVMMAGLMDDEEWQFVQTCHAYLDGYSDGKSGLKV
jgi:hypothetical protein